MENGQLVYEFHTTRVDISFKDTRAPTHRTVSGWVRPYFSFCFVPGAKLVLAYGLSAEQPDQHTLAALLYTAITPSPVKPYGGVPDEVRLFGFSSVAPTIQHVFDHFGILAQDVSHDPSQNGKVERFLATLQKAFWLSLIDSSSPEDPQPRNRREDLTLDDLDGMLRHYLIASNQAVYHESEVSSLAARQADTRQLATLLDEWLPRTVLRDGISYRARRYWHERFANLAPGTAVLLHPTPSFSVSSPETIEVFFQRERICSFAVQP